MSLLCGALTAPPTVVLSAAPPPPRPLSLSHTTQERHIRRTQQALWNEFEVNRLDIEARDNSTAYFELQHAASLVGVWGRACVCVGGRVEDTGFELEVVLLS